MKNLNVLLRKCKSLSRQLGRSTSFGSGHLRECSKSSRESSTPNDVHGDGEGYGRVIVYVGRSRRRYAIDSKHLSHPLINALIEKSSSQETEDVNCNAFTGDQSKRDRISIKCEVVLFDHLLWMLENVDPDSDSLLSSQSLEELTELYML